MSLLMFLVSCYRLAKARPKVWRPPSLTLAPHSVGLLQCAVWQSAAGARKRCPADAAPSQDGGSPSSRLSPGDVPLCGSETPLCWAVCSTQVWTLVSQPCITDHSGGTGGWIVPCVACSVLLCMLEWRWPRVCDIYCHDTLLQPPLVEPVLFFIEKCWCSSIY